MSDIDDTWTYMRRRDEKNRKLTTNNNNDDYCDDASSDTIGANHLFHLLLLILHVILMKYR